MLINFDLDVALVEGEVNHPDLQLLPCAVTSCSVVVPPSTRWPGAASCDADLQAATWILRELVGTRQTFERAMHGLLPKLQILLSSSQRP